MELVFKKKKKLTKIELIIENIKSHISHFLTGEVIICIWDNILVSISKVLKSLFINSSLTITFKDIIFFKAKSCHEEI